MHQQWVGTMMDKLLHKELEMGEGGEEQYRTRVPKTFQPYRLVLADLTVQLLRKKTEWGIPLLGRVVIVYKCQ